MGEGLLRMLASDRFTSLSAGSKPSGYVHPLAVQAMDEISVDLSGHRSKSIEEFLPSGTESQPDLVISVCSNAASECPTFPGRVDRLHWPFDDPADATGTDDEKLVVFRRVRDEIRARLEKGIAAGELG